MPDQPDAPDHIAKHPVSQTAFASSPTIETPKTLPPLRDVIRDLSLTAKKSLGQNYILDLNLTRRIARAAAPLAARHIIEVGPGPGGLTRGLLMEGAGHVSVIERDPRFRPALDDISAAFPGRLSVTEADALHVDLPELALQGAGALSQIKTAPGHAESWVVANLPYNVGTQLLLNWLTTPSWPPFYGGLVLMFQREVADRIVAQPGSKAYGRLSILANWRTEARIELTLPPEAFTPPPKVASALVRLIPRNTPEPAGSAQCLGQVTAAAFGQRRKMLRASLKGVFPDPEVALGAAGIRPTARAEEIDVSGFCRLAEHLAQTRNA